MKYTYSHNLGPFSFISLMSSLYNILCSDGLSISSVRFSGLSSMEKPELYIASMLLMVLQWLILFHCNNFYWNFFCCISQLFVWFFSAVFITYFFLWKHLPLLELYIEINILHFLPLSSSPHILLVIHSFFYCCIGFCGNRFICFFFQQYFTFFQKCHAT